MSHSTGPPRGRSAQHGTGAERGAPGAGPDRAGRAGTAQRGPQRASPDPGARAGGGAERGGAGGRALRVNPIACEAHGMCVELLPELITADPWGYPVVAPGYVPGDLVPLARRAVAACPTLALLLDQEK